MNIMKRICLIQECVQLVDLGHTRNAVHGGEVAGGVVGDQETAVGGDLKGQSVQVVDHVARVGEGVHEGVVLGGLAVVEGEVSHGGVGGDHRLHGHGEALLAVVGRGVLAVPRGEEEEVAEGADSRLLAAGHHHRGGGGHAVLAGDLGVLPDVEELDLDGIGVLGGHLLGGIEDVALGDVSADVLLLVAEDDADILFGVGDDEFIQVVVAGVGDGVEEGGVHVDEPAVAHGQGSDRRVEQDDHHHDQHRQSHRHATVSEGFFGGCSCHIRDSFL